MLDVSFFDSDVKLANAIRQSSKTLAVLTVAHRSDMDELLVGVVGDECHFLKVLEIYRVGGDALTEPRRRGSRSSIQFPSSWKASLDSLVFKSGTYNLVCNQSLLKNLQHARRVTINSLNLGACWLVDLLSSNPNLETVEVREQVD